MAELVKIESKADMLFTPKSGYITKVLGYDEEGNITEIVKKSDGTFVTVGGGGSSDGYVVVEDGGVLKAQKLAFDGTVASPDGSAEEIGSVGIFATGMEEPAYKGSGGGSFYKCSSVEEGTWSGNKALIDGETGVWSFSEEVTSGLPYNKIIPKAGKVYDEECTFIVSGFDAGMLIPTDGLVFYAPLSTDYKDVVNEATVKQSGGVFTTLLNKPCLYANGSDTTIVKWDCAAEISTGAFTIFGLLAYDSTSSWDFLFGYGTVDDDYQMAFLKRADSDLQGRMGGSDWSGDISLPTKRWYSSAITRDASGNCVLYYNGNAVKTDTFDFTLGMDEIRIGSNMRGSHTTPSSYYADCCIYNRALTAEEVLSMHNNLMPQ